MSTLFVVDDDIVYHRIIKMTFIKAPVFKHVYYYSEGAPMLSYLRENRKDFSNLPDVIFLDINMPALDGWAVLDAIAEIYNSLCKKIMVYVVSASVMPQDAKRAMSYPFVQEFVWKPLYRDKLVAIGQSVKDAIAAQKQ